MSIKSSLAGRLRNTVLKPSTPLLPLFEAVINSIHAISDGGLSSSDGIITVTIIRDTTQQQLSFGTRSRGAAPREDIVGFHITDNGVGFDDANLDAFETLDSLHKVSEGGKGIGRLTWLKAFDSVFVTSVYLDDHGHMAERTFRFHALSDGVGDLKTKRCDKDAERETTVQLSGFYKEYRDAAPKTAPAIAKRLLEHCLWYFIREGGAPTIVIRDSNETISMQDIYDEYMVDSIRAETLEVKGVKFDIDHIKLKYTSQSENFIALCANNREVLQRGIGSAQIPGLRAPLRDGGETFVYSCYVTSTYLDGNVRPERNGFTIPADPSELFAQAAPAMSEIENAVVAAARNFLDPYLVDMRAEGRRRVVDFVEHKAARYRSILTYLVDADFWIDPDISDKELEGRLHAKWYEIERSLIEDGADVLKFAPRETREQYSKRIEKYKSKVEAIKQSALADYVIQRRAVLEILTEAVRIRDDGKYQREDLIHQLVMPMRKTSDEVPFEESNLWLIDERLAFHHYLASDRPITTYPVSESDSKTEPDICIMDVMDKALLVSDSADPLATLTIVEFKRPMRDDLGLKEDPIDQTLDYLKLIRDGGVRTRDGRPILNAREIPGFCYIICDLTPKMKDCCERHQLRPGRDGYSYFGYHDPYKTYIEVISYNQMIKGAKERNYAFFSTLGLPC